MTVMVHAPTADPFGIVGTFPDRFRRTASSTLNAELVSERIREVLAEWAADSPAAREVTDGAAVPGEVRPYPKSPVAAVEFIAAALGLSADAVLRAAGVARRTYFQWKEHPGRTPRRRSLGRLWPLTDVLHALATTNPGLAGWFHSDKRAQAAFAKADVNAFLQAEADWMARNYPAQLRRVVEFDQFDDEYNDECDDEAEGQLPTPPMGRRARRGGTSSGVVTDVRGDDRT